MNPTKAVVAVTLALLLSGCAQAASSGPVPPLDTAPISQSPVPAPTTPAGTATATPKALTPEALPPAVIVEEYRHRLQEEIQNWTDGMCVDAPGSLDCTAATLGLNRHSGAAALALENARPWPSDQAELADRTLARLKAVSRLTKDETASMSMLDPELLSLDRTLQSWSAFSG